MRRKYTRSYQLNLDVLQRGTLTERNNNSLFYL